MPEIVLPIPQHVPDMFPNVGTAWAKNDIQY